MHRFFPALLIGLLSLSILPSLSLTHAETEESSTSQVVCNTSTQVCIDLSIRLQGILKQPVSDLKTITMDVTLQGGELLQDPITKTIPMTASGNGIWTGKVQFEGVFVSGTTASNFKMQIKPPQHLKRIICDNNPFEYSAGSYQCSDEGTGITLKLGKNTVDLSRIYFLAGDLPIDEKQNGVINAEDIVYLRNNLATTDETIQITTDLNRDGIVDTQDLSLAVYTLTITNVDEDIVLF